MKIANVIARVLAGSAWLLLAGASYAQSPGYPDRPVRIIVPFAAAGPTDVVARLIAQKLSEKLGQQFYIENMAGAGGNHRHGRRRQGAGRRPHDPDRVVELQRQSESLRQGALRPRQGLRTGHHGGGLAQRAVRQSQRSRRSR